MPLTPGTKLGPYDVGEPLGAGGMGEVYRATDTRLDRFVAIKVLPEHLATNPNARERFEREAKTISSLNHPHICTLHDVGEQDGIHFLVMELVDGETLSDRLRKGPLKLDQALEYATQIAAALDTAHRNSVVHRDLKPGNIMITAPGVKLFDFGLAKLLDNTEPASLMSQVPTREADPITAEGTVLGTMHYMAPEQLQGQHADARSDIFAFGAVLYEMITGNKAFDGKSQFSVMAAIMEHDPEPLAKLQKMTPSALDRLVCVCLAKDPDDRWQTARDLARELDWIRTDSTPSEPTPGRRNSSMFAWAVAATLAAVAAYLYVAGRAHPPDQRVQLEVVTPFTDEPESLAISPDGTQLAFVARSEGISQLWLRELATGDARPLPGTEGAHAPFWSPDGRSIGFFSLQQLRRLELAGGSVRALTSLLAHGGGSWGDNGEILFGAIGGIYSIPASGGERTLVLKPDGTMFDYRFPQWLPGNKSFIFFKQGWSASDHSAIYVGSPDGRVHQRLVDSDTGAIYMSSGHLAFVQGGTLHIQRFDAERLRVEHDPAPLADIVVNFWGYPAVSASNTGTLTFRALASPARNELVRLDRSGTVLAKLASTLRTVAEPELSPGGDRVAMVSVNDEGAADIWIYEEARASSQPLTIEPKDDFWPVWSNDGSRIAFGTTRNILPEIWSRTADRSLPAVQLLDLSTGGPLHWSPDGEFLLYQDIDAAASNYDIRVMPLGGGQAPIDFGFSRFNETRGQFSPDGQWIAYQSDESGRPEIYVRPFPGPGGVQTVSTAGGVQPRWSASGESGKTLELFFLSLSSAMMSVRLEPSPDGPRLESGIPQELFETRIVGGAAHPINFKHFYDVASDGQSFVMVVTPETATTAPISVILNWSANIDQ